MIEAIEHRKNAPEKYSRPQRRAVAHGINQIPLFDYQQYLRQPFSLAFSDFESCYDRIVHSSASIALQRLGITLPSIISMLGTIKCMSHTIRTSYGYYNLTYSGEIIPEEFRNFIIGIYQGNGCAPQLWLMLTSILFSTILSQGFGIHFVIYFTT